MAITWKSDDLASPNKMFKERRTPINKRLREFIAGVIASRKQKTNSNEKGDGMGRPGDDARMAKMRARRAPFTDPRDGRLKKKIRWAFWNSAGAAKRGLVEERTKALLESGYFSELTQYGVPHAPVWRGSLIVTDPAPPSFADNADDFMNKVLRMVEDLLEDHVFPDPDDGPSILFVVLLPDTLTLGPDFGASGAHSNDYDVTFPWNDDGFWVGWIGPGQPVDPPVGGDSSLMKTLSHEVVETLTDPEGTAWRTASADRGRREICDAGVSVTGS